MEIKNVVDNVYSRFEIWEDGKAVGELAYDTSYQDRLIIKHTSVLPSVEGKGYGKALIKEAVKLASESGLEIVTVCSYAAKMKKDHPELFQTE